CRERRPRSVPSAARGAPAEPPRPWRRGDTDPGSGAGNRAPVGRGVTARSGADIVRPLALLLVSCIVTVAVDLRTRVTVLSESADRDGPQGSLMRPGGPVGITRVRYPGQGSTRLMRVMQTNACSLSCGYCPTFCGCQVLRTFLSP